MDSLGHKPSQPTAGPPRGTRRPVAAVVGASVASPALLAEARQLGRQLVDAGFRLVTGGMGGVMEAACRGAHDSPAWIEGTTVGILPTDDTTSANPWVDVALPTGMGIGRNILVVRAADVVIAVGGGSGTLSEVAFAWQLGTPIVALDLGEGWSSRLAGERLDERHSHSISKANSTTEAVSQAQGALDQKAESWSGQ